MLAHGVSDDDIRHGLNNAVAAITTPDQPDFTMIVGADLNAQLLEIGVLAAEDNERAGLRPLPSPPIVPACPGAWSVPSSA